MNEKFDLAYYSGLQNTKLCKQTVKYAKRYYNDLYIFTKICNDVDDRQRFTWNQIYFSSGIGLYM